MDQPLVVFRADSSIGIGTGHAMRCLTLARTLRASGATVHFTCVKYPGNVVETINADGFGVSLLDLSAVHGSGEIGQGDNLAADAAQMLHLLKKLGTPVDWLVVDNYQLSSSWESRLRARVKYILAIDDLANRSHDCDVLLDQNLYEQQTTRYTALVSPSCRVLLGPRYALLRDEFRQRQASARLRDGVIRKILVFFGGTDPFGETLKALTALQQLREPAFEVAVVVGNNNPHSARIADLCSQAGYRYIQQTDDIALLMDEADLALGAVGTTSWERACMGLPTIAVAIADNQVELARTLARCGALIYLGERPTVSPSVIAAAIENARARPELVLSLSTRSRSLVDGKGAGRVAKQLLHPDRFSEL